MTAYVAEPAIAMSNTGMTAYRMVLVPSLAVFSGVIGLGVKRQWLNET
jgi:hypothetical protein